MPFNTKMDSNFSVEMTGLAEKCVLFLYCDNVAAEMFWSMRRVKEVALCLLRDKNVVTTAANSQ